MIINQLLDNPQIQKISSQLEQISGVEKCNFSSNISFSLADKSGLYFLIEGEINCFYTPENQLSSSNSRLFSLNSYHQGQFFLTGNKGFQAIPANDSQCFYIPYTSIQAIEDMTLLTILCRALDQAIEQIDVFLSPAIESHDSQFFSADKSTQGLKWQRINSSKQIEVDNQLINFSPPYYLPKLSSLSFEEQPEGEQPTLLILTTLELCQQQLIEVSLQALSVFLDQEFTHWHQNVLQSESVLLQQNLLNKKQTFINSLRNFVQLLKPDNTYSSTHQPPIYQACQVLGKQIGIHFRLPDNISSSNDELLKDITRSSHMRMRHITLKGNWYQQRSGSLLGFWKESGLPVSLLNKGNNNYKVYDPQINTYQKLNEEVVQKLSSQAVMFYRPLPEHSLTGKDLIDFALFNNNRDLWTLFFMSCGVGLIGLLTPLATGLVFDDLIPSGETNQLWQLGLGLLIAAIAVAAFQYTQGIAVNRLEGLISAPLEAALWDRVLNLPSTFFRQYSSGDLATRLYSIRTIHQLISGSVVSSFLALGAGLFNFILMYYVAWKLALVATALSLFLVTIVILGFLLQIKYYSQMVEINVQLQAHTLQIINTIARLKINGCEIFAFNSWAEKYAKQRENTFKARKIANQVDAFISTARIFSLGCFIIVITHYQGEQFSVGEFLKFSSAFAVFLYAMLIMASSTMSLAMVNPLYRMLKPILTEIPEIDSQKKHPGHLTGELEISKLNFCYSKDKPNIISDFSLTIKAGTFVAIVGASGCGKSTLLRLLLGFEKPQQGTILYNHQELENLDILEVRRQLGVVLQNGNILSGSIMENIIGAYNCSREQAKEAARLAGLADDIEQMPMKYETYVRDGTLSGGQQQRLLIARAIVNKPNILFFDEATSALDNKTQFQVSQSLDNLKATRIVIAHRLSTIKNADIIVVMDKGKIIQQGTYQHLIQQQGLFSELVKRQIE